MLYLTSERKISLSKTKKASLPLFVTSEYQYLSFWTKSTNISGNGYLDHRLGEDYFHLYQHFSIMHTNIGILIYGKISEHILNLISIISEKSVYISKSFLRQNFYL
jgi:hypothetical protein